MIEMITQILEKAHTKEINIPPTLLYNEGWMVRLLVELSIKERIHIDRLDFSRISKWYSEGLLTSPFLPRYRGDIRASGQGETLGIIEAKMGSPLSSGTKNQPGYDQASRNLACLAFNALNTNHELYFIVVAPEVKIEEYNFKEIVNLDYMIPQIEKRFDLYKKESIEIFEKKEATVKRAKNCNCLVLSYKEWLNSLKETKA